MIEIVQRIVAVCGLVSLVLLSRLPVATAQDGIDFRRDIQPLLASRCYKCHGPSTAEGGLRLDDRTAALKPADSGKHAVVPSKPQESELLKRTSASDESERMPPDGKPLTAAQIALLRDWIAQGAEFRNHWAFEPVTRPTPPTVKQQTWVKNPIDAFVLHGLEHAGLQPAPPADPVTLIRRITFDLTGLPPTPAEVDEWQEKLKAESRKLGDQVSSHDSAAFSDQLSALVDKLLDSPRYGERWARHWLDLVRYADTNSFERDGVKPNAWKYRDYVIRSFNDDKPYDRFIKEQLAGDEFPQPTIDALTATGYYRLGLWDDEPADRKLARYDELDDILSTTSQVFLGLTLGCARCHEHKIDPIPQRDYYSMLAFIHEVPSYGTRSTQGMASQSDVSPPEIVAQHIQKEERKRRVEKELRDIERAGIVKMSSEDQRKSEGGGRRKLLEEKLRDYLDAEQWKQYGELQAELKQIEQLQLPPRETVLAVAYEAKQAPETFIWQRGNPHVPGAKVEPAFLTVLGGETPRIAPSSAAAKTTGRRTALANWLASDKNPLTARVMVNRVWQFHFGRGLVRSSSNFGYASTPPTHPELLDWLASEFMRNGWKLKDLHKLIVLSNTYRMSSHANATALAKDPTNDRLWRFDMRRLSAEEMRDAMLAVTGQLNLAMFGPGVRPEISAEVLAGQSNPGSGWAVSPKAEQNRRSIYVHVKRSLILPLLADFDFCDTDTSCAVRFSTTQPTQALGMINGKFAHDQATAFADRLRREAGADVEKQVTLALRLALGRPTTPADIDHGKQLIAALRERHKLSADQALKYYCLTVLNLNEFAYLD
ncbi:MAG: PSD1 domain-containing protein [Planctomycetaceae bacterium]|nr:PSD1 domain-containing protein [Planctomycetaceae bacterium]